ncbi:MAG: hypothetical protein HOC71_10990 [Candidatus Latescibacteria bacterium]|nr:hypothetical protein [Candidatus Latescibacterota bacterium]
MQNSRNSVPLRQAAILHPKNPPEYGAFQRGLEKIVYNPSSSILFCRTVMSSYRFAPFGLQVEIVIIIDYYKSKRYHEALDNITIDNVCFSMSIL